MLRSLFLCAVCSAFLLASVVPAQTVPAELVRASAADPTVQNFDEQSVVLNPAGTGPSTPLALFLPGTNGKPSDSLLLQTIAGQGYRVISLAYDDTPAVSQVCPRDPNPECSARFRQVRTFGRGPAGPVQNPPEEAINARLVALLHYLDREHPTDGWGIYLTAEGRPAWNRMVVSGLSQGAGMAAFIAKFYPVDRVVLFSSPWDVTGPQHRPAPWLFRPSATPPERWWAERHVQENTTQWIANAYAALQIPPDHVFLFDQPHADGATGENPYHPSTIRNPAYVPQWKRMYGAPGR